jgi:hypothetical protein
VLAYVGPTGLSTKETSFPPSAYNALAYVANVPGSTTALTMSFQGAQVGTMNVALRPGASVVAFLSPTP